MSSRGSRKQSFKDHSLRSPHLKFPVSLFPVGHKTSPVLPFNKHHGFVLGYRTYRTFQRLRWSRHSLDHKFSTSDVYMNSPMRRITLMVSSQDPALRVDDFKCLTSLYPHVQSLWKMLLSFQFYKWRSWSWRRLSSFTKSLLSYMVRLVLRAGCLMADLALYWLREYPPCPLMGGFCNSEEKDLF